MKSVTVPRGKLRPIAPASVLTCLGCANQARWYVGTSVVENAELCSSCVLYASPLVEMLEDLPNLVAEVEAVIGRRLTRDDRGNLSGQDADRIVFSICAVSNAAPKMK